MKKTIGIIALLHILPFITLMAGIFANHVTNTDVSLWLPYLIGWGFNVIGAVFLGMIRLIAWCFD